MGIYLNPGNVSFQKVINSEIYVDKALLIKYTNKIINTNDLYVCFSRPRRFGKSTDARMLAAYYDNSCDSKKLFDNLKIAKSDVYLKNMNQYNVILLNMQDFLSETNNIEEMIQNINKYKTLIIILNNMSVFAYMNMVRLNKGRDKYG